MPRGNKLKPRYSDFTLTGQCGISFDGATNRVVDTKFRIHTKVCSICHMDKTTNYIQKQTAHIMRNTGKVIEHIHPNPNFKKLDKKNLNPKRFKSAKGQKNNSESNDTEPSMISIIL